MDFYASWTSRDPEFTSYFSSVKLLISPACVPQSWHVENMRVQPEKLFVDSGSYTNICSPDKIHPKEVLIRQVAMSKGYHNPACLYLAHPDVPLPRSLPYDICQKRIKASAENAFRYMDLVQKACAPGIPVAVLHAFDEETLALSYYAYKDAGYRHFALGSLSARATSDPALAEKIILWACEYGARPLHLFGVGTAQILARLRLSVDSVDSSAAVKEAYHGACIYSRPLRRVVVAPTAERRLRERNFSFNAVIEEPLPCACPVCSENPQALIAGGERERKMKRALHNYYHLREGIEHGG